MGLKSLHFESPGRRNFNVFAQLNFVYATRVKIAPLPHENLILTYSRLPKMSKNHRKTRPRGLQNRYRLAKGLGTPKITIFMLKTSIFGWPKILDFFQNRARGGTA